MVAMCNVGFRDLSYYRTSTDIRHANRPAPCHAGQTRIGVTNLRYTPVAENMLYINVNRRLSIIYYTE
jgi:hypothetical protein